MHRRLLNFPSLLQLEDLYVEILYTILHMIGSDADHQRKLELFKHLQAAFFMENEKHQQLLDIASMREVLSRLDLLNFS